jgi:hypothetical protein
MLIHGEKLLPRGTADCLKKRRLLNEKDLSPALCQEYGEKFFELGWWEDALEFFKKCNDTAGLEKIRTHCLETGDAYLLTRLGETDPQVWRRLGERALALEKFYFARQAFEFAADADKAAMVAGLIAGADAGPLHG